MQRMSIPRSIFGSVLRRSILDPDQKLVYPAIREHGPGWGRERRWCLMLDRASQAAVHCNRVQVRPSGKSEVALWSSSAMASLASGLDQWGYRAGVRNVRGITSTGAGIVLGTLLDPLADQGDLGSGQRCLWRSW